jgi:hypothetical protein
MVAERLPHSSGPHPETTPIPTDAMLANVVDLPIATPAVTNVETEGNVVAFRKPKNGRLSDAVRRYRAIPEVKSHTSAMTRDLWKDDKYRAKVSERLQGHSVSDETKKKLRDKATTHFSDLSARLEVSNRKNGIMQIGLILFSRGASVSEVMEYTGENDRRKIENCLVRLRAAGLVPKPTSEETREAKRKAHKGKSKIQHDNLAQLSEDDQKVKMLSKKFIEAGLLNGNTFYWDKLYEIYQKAGREMPASVAEKLRYEVYIKVLMTYRNGGKELREKYVKMGKEVFPDNPEKTGFSLTEMNGEEAYIRTQLNAGKVEAFFDKYSKTMFGIVIRSGHSMNAEDLLAAAKLKTLTDVDFPVFADDADGQKAAFKWACYIIREQMRFAWRKNQAKLRGEGRVRTFSLGEESEEREINNPHVIYLAHCTDIATESAEDQALELLEPEVRQRTVAEELVFDYVHHKGERFGGEREVAKRLAALAGISFGEARGRMQRFKAGEMELYKT